MSPLLRSLLLDGRTPLQTLRSLPGAPIILLATEVAGTASGSGVATWPDLGPQGKHAVQATSAKRPTYSTSGGPGGRPCLTFDGVDDCFTIPSVSLGAFTILIAFKSSGSGGLMAEHGPDAFGTVNGSFFNSSVNSVIAANRSGNGSAKNTIAAAAWGVDGTYRIAAQVMDGTHAGHRLFVNAAERPLEDHVYTAAPGTGTYTDTLNIGARNAASAFLPGAMSAVVICNAALDAGQIATASRALNRLFPTY